jgi:hypothetical protein
MKYLIIIISFLNFNSTLNLEQNNSIFEAIETQVSLEEQFYDRLEVKTNFPKMLNKYVDRKASTRTEVPNSLWQDIKSNIDYTFFKAEVIGAITDYYTDTELQSLIDSNASKPKIPITKLDFRVKLGQIIEGFIDTKFLVSANSVLISNGYAKID